jgi:hypothetical protein
MPNKGELKKFSLYFILAMICFGKATDEFSDPYRFFHGVWHILGTFSTFHAY